MCHSLVLLILYSVLVFKLASVITSGAVCGAHWSNCISKWHNNLENSSTVCHKKSDNFLQVISAGSNQDLLKSVAKGYNKNYLENIVFLLKKLYY